MISESTFLLAADELFRGSHGGRDSDEDEDVEQVIAEVMAHRVAHNAQQQAELLTAPPAVVSQPTAAEPRPVTAPLATQQAPLPQQDIAPQPIASRKREVDRECLPGWDVYEYRPGDSDEDYELGSDDNTQERPA